MKLATLTRITRAALFGVLTVPLADPKDIVNTELTPVTVYVHVSFADTGLAPTCAKGIASRMFAKAAIRVNWRTDWDGADQTKKPILIDITSNTPERLYPGAFAYAQVYEGVHIRIFWDRVREMGGGPNLANTLLAHVMVHEITHILEGIERHSREGVMKAHWTARDVREMACKPLPFDSLDLTLIRSGVTEIRRR